MPTVFSLYPVRLYFYVVIAVTEFEFGERERAAQREVLSKLADPPRRRFVRKARASAPVMTTLSKTKRTMSCRFGQSPPALPTHQRGMLVAPKGRSCACGLRPNAQSRPSTPNLTWPRNGRLKDSRGQWYTTATTQRLRKAAQNWLKI